MTSTGRAVTTGALALARRRGPDAARATAIVGALALVAPLEHAAGQALGLGDVHAWTVTVTVEGAAGAALLAGRWVGAALALTGASILLGALQSARTVHGGIDRGTVALAVGLTVLVVASLALAHRVREAIITARTVDDAAVRDAAERAATTAFERAEQARAAEHARTMDRDRLAALHRDQATRAALDTERVRLASVQAEADAERARADAAADRVRAEQERARADEARAQAEHERAAERARAEQAASAAARHEARTQRRPARSQGKTGDLTERRARTEWRRAEQEGTPLTGSQLGALLGITPGAARKVAAKWRAEPSPAAPEARGAQA